MKRTEKKNVKPKKYKINYDTSKLIQVWKFSSFKLYKCTLF